MPADSDTLIYVACFLFRTLLQLPTATSTTTLVDTTTAAVCSVAHTTSLAHEATLHGMTECASSPGANTITEGHALAHYRALPAALACSSLVAAAFRGSIASNPSCYHGTTLTSLPHLHAPINLITQVHTLQYFEARSLYHDLRLHMQSTRRPSLQP